MTPLPDDVAPYKRTPTFTEATVPAGLLKAHATKAGVWGLIHVEHGRLRYAVEAGGAAVELTAEGPPGVIEPEVRHSVAPVGAVRFFVEFYR